MLVSSDESSPICISLNGSLSMLASGVVGVECERNSNIGLSRKQSSSALNSRCRCQIRFSVQAAYAHIGGLLTRVALLLVPRPHRIVLLGMRRT
jgi:hypothetical protein